jgi:hypothetical protein
VTSPITAQSRKYVRSRATEVMEYECIIERGLVSADYDESTLIYTSPDAGETIYQGPCRVWELSGAGAIVVGDSDVYQQTTSLSIPWDTAAVVKRYDVVTILGAPQDSQMVGKRFEVQSVAKAGELRATRRFEVTGLS